MKNSKIRVLSDWTEFESALCRELDLIEHKGPVLVRNFLKETYPKVDRLALTLCSGTDRDINSEMVNDPDFDHDHERHPSGKTAKDIFYAYYVEILDSQLKIYHNEEPEYFDLVSSLSEHDAVSIYNTIGTKRVAKNEYWFEKNPLECLLFVFTIN